MASEFSAVTVQSPLPELSCRQVVDRDLDAVEAPRRPSGAPSPIHRGAPHSAQPVGTRVTVDGSRGYYVGFKLPAFGRMEHTVHFDRGGRQTLRGDRCHLLRVLWWYSFRLGWQSTSQASPGR